MKRPPGSKPRPSAAAKDDSDSDSESNRGERLQKVLAAAGVGSRRQCEEFITSGRVEIDRQVVTKLGTCVDPVAQEIRVDGEAIKRPNKLYFAVNKPIGVVTTNFDPSGRSRVIDLVPTQERVFAVGRLDRSSEGLILVTNDGEFANRLTHPRYGVEKTYLVRIAGSPEAKELERLKKGVHLAEGYARAQSIVVKKHHGQSTDLVIVLNEGRNREIRRIFARVGHKVLAIKRVAVGNIKLSDLPLGASRRLQPTEVAGLLHISKQKRRTEKKPEAKPTLARSASEGKRSSTATTSSPPDDGYVQKQALLAQPLSLDDLLRDDLDEGPLPPLRSPGQGSPEIGDDESIDAAETQGGVIEYDDDFSFSPPPRAPGPAGSGKRGPGAGGSRRPPGGPRAPRGAKSGQHSKRPDFKKPRRDDQESGSRGGSGERAPRVAKAGHGSKRPNFRNRQNDQEGPPRESFGKKRGGKRSFGAIEGSRGPAGDQAGKFRARPKQKKKDERPQVADNQRRGQRRGAARGGKPFGKPGGGNRKGSR